MPAISRDVVRQAFLDNLQTILLKNPETEIDKVMMKDSGFFKLKDGKLEINENQKSRIDELIREQCRPGLKEREQFALIAAYFVASLNTSLKYTVLATTDKEKILVRDWIEEIYKEVANELKDCIGFENENNMTLNKVAAERLKHMALFLALAPHQVLLSQRMGIAADEGRDGMKKDKLGLILNGIIEVKNGKMDLIDLKKIVSDADTALSPGSYAGLTFFVRSNTVNTIRKMHELIEKEVRDSTPKPER